MTRQLAKHEEAFHAAGIATRDSNGELRNSLDIMLDATSHPATLKEGTDRNVEGQRLFGRAWQEVSPIVRLTAETMREAGDRAQALGLEVGGEQVAATKRYRHAMAGAHDVLLGVENAIDAGSHGDGRVVWIRRSRGRPGLPHRFGRPRGVSGGLPCSGAACAAAATLLAMFLR